MNDEVSLKDRLLGIGTEVGTGIGTDVATSGLLVGGPLGWLAYAGINFGSGAYTNYLVQKHLYGQDNVNWGEILASGAMGMIPFMDLKAGKLARLVGKTGTVQRGIVGGALVGLGGEQLRVGIDEQRFLNPLEAAISIGVGGGLGGGFTAAGQQVGKQVNKQLDTKVFQEGQKIAAELGLPTDKIDIPVEPRPPIPGGLQEQVSPTLKARMMAQIDDSRPKQSLETWISKFGVKLGKQIKKAVDKTKQGTQLVLGREADNIKTMPGMEIFAMDPSSAEAKRVLLNGFAIKSGYKNWADFKKNVINVYPAQEELLYKFLRENPGVGQIEHKIAKASKIARMNVLRERFPNMNEQTLANELARRSKNTFDMDWYWEKEYIGRDGKWHSDGLNKGDRNSFKNTLPDFNTRQIRLKNVVEQIGYGGEGKKGYVLAGMSGRKVERVGREPGILWQGAPKDRLIVNIKAKNPKASLQKQVGQLGNIQIVRARDGEIIGEIGEYMDALYPADPRVKRSLIIALRRQGIVGRKAIAQWRREQILKRLETIIRDAPKLPKTPKLREQAILKGLQDDMDELFDEFDFLTPQFYDDLIEDMSSYPDMFDTYDTGYI